MIGGFVEDRTLVDLVGREAVEGVVRGKGAILRRLTLIIGSKGKGRATWEAEWGKRNPPEARDCESSDAGERASAPRRVARGGTA